MLKEIKSHRSIRQFESTPIEDNVLNDILTAASRGSNTGNMQAYSIIVTKDAVIRHELCQKCHFGQKMVDEAPVVLTFCADFNRFTHWCEMRNAEPGYDNFLSFFTASVDATIAAENAAIEAESHGLGVCFLGTTNYTVKEIIDVLELPKYVMPVTTLVIGYPSSIPSLTERLPMRAVVHNEIYNDFTDKDIENVYNELETSEKSRQLVAENKTDNLAQIFTFKRYTKSANITYSREMLEMLEKQGFMNNK